MDELLRRLLLNRYVEARRWLEQNNGRVQRTLEGSRERVVIALPSGVRSGFVVDEPRDFEEGVVLAVDEMRG